MIGLPADIRDLYRESSIDISQAMQKLEEAGQRQEIPQGYLVRAQLRRRLGNYPGAERDLAEAERLAKRSGLTALRCDIAFEKAWLALRQGQFDFANTYLEQAKQDVERMEYHCRHKELVALEIRLKNSQTSL